eukprot:GILJ01003604.1.p1 GENE.GILJ01003604.1~~GILJ01003604.1.p1  ORF type:complete len:345 (+),score=34.92 GILJ01003604.1:51-1085(+)
MSAIQQLRDALDRADRAVAMDREGQYRDAIILYQEASSMISSQITRVLEDQRSVLINYARLYTERATVLNTHLEQQESVPLPAPAIPSSNRSVPTNPFPAFAIDFEEEPIPTDSVRDVPPQAPSHRPYWLMRVLARILATGGHLTSRIYIPKAIWQLEGAKLAGLNVKMDACEALLDRLKQIESLDFDHADRLSKELDSFCTFINTVQNNLSRHFSYIHEATDDKKDEVVKSSFGQKMKALGASLAKGATRLGNVAVKTSSSDNSRYMQLITEVMEKSQFLEGWLSMAETEGWTNCIPKLSRVGDFFYSVICALVMRDCAIILEKYIRKVRESFARLYPRHAAK